MASDSFVLTTSPDDLRERLDQAKKSGELGKGARVVLLVDDPRILLCPFEFKAPGWLRWGELKDMIVADAAEMLSLSRDQVTVDFQIFNRVQDRVHGAFLCCSRELLDEYFNILNKAGFSPYGITVPALIAIDHSLDCHRGEAGRAVFIHVSRAKVDLAVIYEHRCELLRVIPFDVPEEALAEIVRSVRSVCAKSQHKDCAHLYALDETGQGPALVSAVAGALGAAVTTLAGEDISSEGSSSRYFRLDLSKQYVFSRENRVKITWAVNILLAVVMAAAIWYGWRVGAKYAEVRGLEKSFTAAEYQHAQELERKSGIKK